MKVRGWKRYTPHTESLENWSGFINIKVDLKTHTTGDEQGHFIMIEESVPEKDITIINIYALNK